MEWWYIRFARSTHDGRLQLSLASSTGSVSASSLSTSRDADLTAVELYCSLSNMVRAGMASDGLLLLLLLSCKPVG